MPLKCFSMLQCRFVKHRSQIELYFFKWIMFKLYASFLLFFSVAFDLIKLVKNKHVINSKIIGKYNLGILRKYWYLCFVVSLFFILYFCSFLFSKL